MLFEKRGFEEDNMSHKLVRYLEMALTLFFSVFCFFTTSLFRSFFSFPYYNMHKGGIRRLSGNKPIYMKNRSIIGESIYIYRRRWKNDKKKRREKQDEIRNYFTFFYTLLFCKGFDDNRVNLGKRKIENWSYAAHQ